MAALVISGDTSGTVTLAAPAIAGTQTYTLPTAVPASNGQVLSATTAGVMSWASVSASAAGSTNQIQYNNGGAFAGTANLVWENGTTVGVGGLSSPSTYGDGAYGFVAYGGSTANYRGHISLGGNTTAADEAMGKIHFFNSNSTNAIYRVCAIQATRGADNNSGHLIFQTANSGSPSEVFRLSATGAAVLRGGTVGATGVGIAFPATQSASTNANTLDDYEEGTWTPTDGSAAGLVFTNASGYYIKTGRVVHCYADFRFPSTSNGNSARINLPIPVDASYGGGGSLNYFYNGTGVPNTVLVPMPQQGNGVPTFTLNGWNSSSQVTNAYCSLYIFRIFISYFSDV